MIGSLRGTIIDISTQRITIELSSGIGYEVLVGEPYAMTHSIGDESSIYVHHQISENNQALYGFETADEKRLFESLIKISGIGGKGALQILSLGTDALRSALQNNDIAALTSVKGIGKKMAEKILFELHDSPLTL